MQYKATKGMLSLLLVLCLLVGLIPSMGLTAVAASTAQAENTITTQEDLQAAINAAAENGESTKLDIGQFEVSKPISVPSTAKITIRGYGNTIRAQKELSWDEHSGIFIMSAGASLTLENMTVDGAGDQRCIYMWGGDTASSLTLEAVTLQKGNAHGYVHGGAAICMEGNGTLTVKAGCSITENVSSTSTVTSGAIYVGPGSTANFNGTADNLIEFNGNIGHSGGAVYVFNSYLHAKHCVFQNNNAGQRGGAIHCHGVAVLENCTLQSNSSDQYGGGVYVSANETAQGKLALLNTSITGNNSKAGGGGIYVAGQSKVYLGDQTEVTGNEISSTVRVPALYRANNLQISALDAQAVACGDVKQVGISTTNPFKRQVVVYSASNAGIDNEVNRDSIPLTETYEISHNAIDGTTATYKYDSDLWILKDKTTDPSAGSGENEEACVKGNLWMNYNPKYITIYETDKSPYVFFDYNMPGMEATVYPSANTKSPISVNEKLTTPAQVTENIGNMRFTLLGWSDQPAGGTLIQPGSQVTVKDGVQIYYAQWDVDIPPDPDPVPVPGSGLFTVYFDYNYPGGGVTSTLVGTVDLTFTLDVRASGSSEGGSVSASGKAEQTKTVTLLFKAPTPYRRGYEFKGWASSPTAIAGNKTPAAPTSSTTFYAIWKANSYTLTWDANTGTGGGQTTQAHDETVKPPTTPPTKTGYEFTGWYLDNNCTIPLTSGTLVTGAATFYAGWTPNEYTITWDANYTGGTLTTVKQHHDEKLNILPKPVRDGYSFGGWYTRPNGAGTRAESYGTVREDVTFYAKWTNETLDYKVKLEWDDQSNNDNVRPESITVSLVANGIPTGLSYTLDATDADCSGNVWSYTFEGLDVTDAVSNPITYSVAITSTVSDQYSYGIENKSAELGYILMTHSLITTDINSYVVWEDDGNNDGYRPSTVNLQLYANGKKVEDAEGRLSISGSGNTWTYTFADFQKYYTDDAGNKGREIRYTLEATPTNPGELDEYSIAYHNYTVILSHRKDTVSRSVHVEWQDSNNQDGKRPVSMAVQLYADNVPLEGKVVLLSNANNWAHTWDDLAKYADGGREVTYSARVSSTLVDYTAKSTGMTIEMTYVPSSTSISAFVTWTDEQDADGLRPDYVTAQLVANGKPTGNSQVLSATSGWTVSWTGYPIYENGDRIEYTFQVDVPDGYEANYHGVYDTSGLSAVLTHQRLKQELTGNIVWEDRDNQSGGRMGSVAVLLYADGSVIDEDDKVWISAEDGWEHTFSNLPVYRDGGQEIKYSMVLVSDPGKYIPTTSKMTITMRLEPEYVDVPFQIIWDDNNDSDGARPGYVAVALLVDGKPSPYGETATAQTDWAVTFTHLDRYGSNGLYIYKAQLAEVPDGYTATYTSPGVVVLKRVAQTKDVTATVTWHDNNNQYRERPEQITLTLYADRLDGNGPQNTGRIAKCKGTEGWTYTFEGVPAFYQGKNIIYSVEASGDLPNYTISYDGMEVFMRHVSYQPPVTVDYTAKVVWHDGHNAKGSRPYNLLVTLYADGESCGSYTMTEADLDATGYTWLHTFTNLPTKVDGKEVVYTIGVTEPAHYIAQTQGNTITMTHVMDIPILVRWHDQNDNDGVRPETLTLELFGDSVKTDTAISLTGAHNAETWRGNFRQIPVWSETQMDHEIVYTWAFARDDLTNSSYRVDYNGFASSTVGNEDLCPIDIYRSGEVSDVTVSLKWDDGSDRDGLRPNALDVELLADGKTTGESLTLTGSNEAESWTGTFEDLPVWNDGNRIVYSMDVAPKEGYTASYNHTTPFNATLTHAPAEAEVKANAEWDKTVKDKFDIAAELLVDGEGTGRIGVLDAENGYEESWGIQYVYRDHGQPINYTVRVAEQTKIPEGHVVEVQGLTVTVKRVKFELTGCVYNNAGIPVPTALVTVIDMSADKILGQLIADSEGRYSITVSSGNYLVQANVSGQSGGAASAIISNLDFDTTQDLTLSGWVSLCDCTIKVVDSNKNAAPGAKVDLSRISQGLLGTLTMDEDGICKVVLPSSSYDFQASYTYQGNRYRSDLVKKDLSRTVETIEITVPIESTATKAISGTVMNAAEEPVPGIVVQCYRRGDGGFLGVEAETDANGNFTLGGLADGSYELVLKDQNGQNIVLSREVVFSIPKDAGTTLNIVLPNSGTHVPTPSGSGTLSGVVKDKDGQLVSGAQVVIIDTATGGTVSILTTSPDGAFETQLPAGEYTVEIRELYDNNSDHPIRVDENAASQEGSAVTADSFTISGEVLDEDGQPLEGVTVYLYGEDGQLLATASLFDVEEPASDDSAADLFSEDGYIRLDERVTAENGKYVFAGLPAGRYVVKIAHGGIGGNGGSTDIPVTVQPLPEIPDDADLTVTTDSYTVSGVVVDKNGEPVNGAKVKLLDAENNEVSSLTTGEDGAYTFDTLPKGDYTVNISYPDSDLLASGDVTITDGSFTAFPGQTVSGKIKDNKGNALSNVTVTLRGEDGKTYTATTDKDGSYRVVVPDGKYTVEVNINGKTASKTITVNGKAVTADLTITLSDGGSTTPGGNTPGGSGGGSGSGGSGGNIGGGGFIPDPGPTEEKTFVLSGTVTDKDGNPVEGANVTATDAKSGKTYTDTTGADGKYALAVPKGSYTITISYGSVSSNPKKVSVSKDSSLDAIPMDSLGKLVLAYVNGYADGTFGGERHITRSEVAALISRVSEGFDKGKSYGVDFKDVPDGVWYANNLGYCVEAGLIQGRGNGMFDPNANITRAEFAAIVARFLGLPNEVTGANRYTDTTGNWAEGYIAQLTVKGIVEGKGDGKFDPNANISRYEAVTMLNRALDRTPDKAALDALAANRTIRPFPDLHPTHWAYHQVLEAAFNHYHK